MLEPGGTWWVLGSVASTLELHSPAALSTTSSPVTLTGQSTATMTFPPPTAGAGAIVVLAISATDGGSEAAGSVHIAYAR